MRLYRPKRYLTIKKFTKVFENAFEQLLENDDYNKITKSVELDNGLVVKIIIEIDEANWEKIKVEREE